jgi:hypothetical protein
VVEQARREADHDPTFLAELDHLLRPRRRRVVVQAEPRPSRSHVHNPRKPAAYTHHVRSGTDHYVWMDHIVERGVEGVERDGGAAASAKLFADRAGDLLVLVDLLLVVARGLDYDAPP